MPLLFYTGFDAVFRSNKKSFGVFAIGERVFIRAAYGHGKPKGYTLREFTGDDLRNLSHEEEKALGF